MKKQNPLAKLQTMTAAIASSAILLGAPGFAAVSGVPANIAAGLSGAPSAAGALHAGAAASFSAPLFPAISAAPALGAANAPLAALAALAAPAAAAAAPAAAAAAAPTQAADAKKAASAPQASTAAGLRALSAGVAAGADGSAETDAAASAAGQAFDNSAPGGKAQGIPLEWVDSMISRDESVDPQTRRLQDIVQRVGFREAALNREILQKHNGSYTVEIPMGTITDQQDSGRCWLFAGLNMIRSLMIADKKVTRDFEFSENYLHFFNMLEKSNRHLEEVSQKLYRRERMSAELRRSYLIPDLGDGGLYTWFSFLVSKYGLVPKSAMRETISSEATGVLLSELDDSVAATSKEMEANAAQFKAGRAANLSHEIRKRGMMRVWKILVTHLGEPPAKFDYRDVARRGVDDGVQITQARVKTYTPTEFAKDFVKFDPKDYVMVTSYPSKKLDTVYEEKNSAIGKSAPGQPDVDLRFLNVSSDRMSALAATAIRGGQPVLFAADILKDVDRNTGIMHPRLYDRASIYQFSPEEAAPALTRKQAAYFDRVGPNHEMVLTGYDQPDPSKPIVKFKVENSWGDTTGSKGVYHLYREWFDQNVFVIVVHKRFLNDDEGKLWRGKASTPNDLY